MSDAFLETLDLEPTSPPRASIIWLHGLGANMHDFEPIVPELNIADSMAVRFVFPNAPTRPVTVNGGMVMRAWFDVLGLEPTSLQDEAGIRGSEEQLRALIEREKGLGVPVGKILLAGFSQGGAVALQTGLRYPESLAGIVALSTFVTLESSLASEVSEANREIPIFMAHGEHDPLIPVEMGRLSRQKLESLGYSVGWHEYPMQHAVCPQEIGDIGKWLRARLAVS